MGTNSSGQASEYFSPESAGPIHWPEDCLPNDDVGAVKLADIIAATCLHFRVSSAVFESGSRKRPVARARQVVSYLGRKLTICSYPKIARAIGKTYDHSSSIWAARKIGSMVNAGTEDMHIHVAEIQIILRTGTARSSYSAWDRKPAPVARRAHIDQDAAIRRLQFRQIGFLPELVS